MAFYFAGLWQPATRTRPEAFAIVTTEANADILPFQDRQGHVIQRGEHMGWLQGPPAKGGDLQPLPAGTFVCEELRPQARRQARLPLHAG